MNKGVKNPSIVGSIPTDSSKFDREIKKTSTLKVLTESLREEEQRHRLANVLITGWFLLFLIQRTLMAWARVV